MLRRQSIRTFAPLSPNSHPVSFILKIYRTEVPKGQKQGAKRQDGDLNDKPGQFPVV
jgi:hypothetical protein